MVVKQLRSKPIMSSLRLSPLILGIEPVQEMAILGVTISDGIGFGHTLTKYAAKPDNPCSRYVFWSSTVTMVHGQRLVDVVRTTTLAQLLYASPVWWGFATVGEHKRL